MNIISRSPLFSDSRGTTIVEFAVLAPVMIVMIAGSVQLGYTAMVRSTLEGATTAAARQAMTGYCPETRAQDMQAFIVDRMSSYSSPEDAPEILVENWGEKVGDVGKLEDLLEDIDDDGEYDYEDGDRIDNLNDNFYYAADDVEKKFPIPLRDNKSIIGDLGGPGDVVSYTVDYRLSPIFPFLNWTDEGGVVSLKATTVVRNEPVFTSECDTGVEL